MKFDVIKFFLVIAFNETTHPKMNQNFLVNSVTNSLYIINYLKNFLRPISDYSVMKTKLR